MAYGLHIGLLTVSAILIVAVNSLCCYVLMTSSRLKRRPPTFLILSLMIVHLVQGAVVIPLYAAFKSQYFVNAKWLCDGYRFTYMLTFYGSCLTVLLLSIDRLIAVRLFISYEKTVTKPRVMKTLAVVWMYTFVLCIIPFYPFEKAMSTLHTNCNYNQPKVWSVLMLLSHSLLPYILIVGIYIYIQRKVSNLNAYFNRLDAAVKSKSKLTRSRRLTKLVCLLLVSYAVTWAPSIVYFNLQHMVPGLFEKDYYGTELELDISFAMKYVNLFDAIIAPLVYCFNHEGFRVEVSRNLHIRSRLRPCSNTDSNVIMNVVNEHCCAVIQNHNFNKYNSNNNNV